MDNTWNIIAEGFDEKEISKQESIFSIGNGAMGMRANFEEDYSGSSLQGSYIGGVYYPDKTRVGWWKNGYPEYFAKVLNAPNWIGIHITINGEVLDLQRCTQVSAFTRQLNMKEGWYERSFRATLPSGVEVQVKALRFLSLRYEQLGALRYEITPLNADVTITVEPYLDSGIKNNDSNWDELFWETTEISNTKDIAVITAKTKKTHFAVRTFMVNKCFINGKELMLAPQKNETDTYIGLQYELKVPQGSTFRLEKFGGYTQNNEQFKALFLLTNGTDAFNRLLEAQKEDWAAIWKTSDIVIEGDEAAQQGIRFNIFQLNQTYSGKHSHLNIGPKGFTGEKYGGSTYWDTEAYCLPFYMATKGADVAKNLLLYRYEQLPQAIANAQKLGFTNEAALYPMVTMNGEECHNEWEITFEEIHRNGAIAFAIYNYTRFTADTDYIKHYGWVVLMSIARFWAERVSFSAEKEKYVILGVTGPNEYENNVNNNFYTNYIAKWCLQYAAETVRKYQPNNPTTFDFQLKTATPSEVENWLHIAQNMYFPYTEKHGIYLQQDGFLDKDLKPVSAIPPTQRPINQHWSWDRILRSPYIKQADTLQTFYFFEEHFTKEELRKHYEFYVPFTLHESSLSPCVHSVLAAALGKDEEAYQLYLRTARLDLDDYNKEVHEGLHITSMAGTWLSVVEGFAGMRVKEGTLVFTPRLPKHWKRLSFKVIFRGEVKTCEFTN